MAGMWCSAAGGDLKVGTIWSHEMGHHWCLSHTFTKQDFANTMPFPSLHDHDDYVGGVHDTPPDPTTLEKSDRVLRCDNSDPCETDEDCGVGPCNTVVLQNHEYCEKIEHDDVSDYSPHASYCTTDCKICEGDHCSPNHSGVENDNGYDPDEHGAMNYFGNACRGPIVFNGTLLKAFSPNSVASRRILVTWQR